MNRSQPAVRKYVLASGEFNILPGSVNKGKEGRGIGELSGVCAGKICKKIKKHKS